MHRIEKGSNVLLNDVYTNVPCVMPSFVIFFFNDLSIFPMIFLSFVFIFFIYFVDFECSFFHRFVSTRCLDLILLLREWKTENEQMTTATIAIWKMLTIHICIQAVFFFFQFHFFLLFLFTSSQPLWFGVDWLHITFGILNISSTQQVTQ